jgi:hypothetical protein
MNPGRKISYQDRALSAGDAEKLDHMGIKSKVSHSSLAYVDQIRDGKSWITGQIIQAGGGMGSLRVFKLGC